MIYCIILEDEKNAQNVLLHYISKTKFIECIGVFESGVDIPISLLKRAEFLFLDIELPELNGIAFLKTIQNPPKVIVTTAYPNFAIEAYEQAVMDYLVKPFSYNRFLKSVNRIRESILNLKEDYLFVYANKTGHKIKVNDILYIKSELDYISIVFENEKILLLDSLNNWEKKLKYYNFIRTHRSYLVNYNRINKVKINKVLLGSIELPIGITYKSKLIEKFNLNKT